MSKPTFQWLNQAYVSALPGSRSAAGLMAPLWAGKQILVIMCLHLLKIERGERVEGWIGCFRGQGYTGHLTRTQVHDSSLTVKEVGKCGCPLCWGRSSWIGEHRASFGHMRGRRKSGDPATLPVSWRSIFHLGQECWQRGWDGEGMSSQWRRLAVPPHREESGEKAIVSALDRSFPGYPVPHL